jgi:hypothetical protein
MSYAASTQRLGLRSRGEYTYLANPWADKGRKLSGRIVDTRDTVLREKAPYFRTVSVPAVFGGYNVLTVYMGLLVYCRLRASMG